MYQKIRVLLFYLSIAVFFVCVPVILIFSLGYNIEWQNLKVNKAGLIQIDSFPQGAQVYLNGRYNGERTPAVLKEIRPGNYRIDLRLKGYYPWRNAVEVKEGKVIDLGQITLFKRIPYLEKVNVDEVSDFTLDKDHNNIYFISKDDHLLYNIDIQGRNPRVVYELSLPAEKIKKWLISPDEKKILYLVGNHIHVGFLRDGENRPSGEDMVISVPDEVLEVFWHADCEHIIVVTPKDIRIFELYSKGMNNIITLTALNFRRPKVFYDVNNNALYFTDTQETSAGRSNNLYRIQLGRRQVFPVIEDLEKKK